MVFVNAKEIFCFEARVLKGVLRDTRLQCDIVIQDLFLSRRKKWPGKVIFLTFQMNINLQMSRYELLVSGASQIFFAGKTVTRIKFLTHIHLDMYRSTTLQQIIHRNTLTRHCSKHFPLNNPSVTSDLEPLLSFSISEPNGFPSWHHGPSRPILLVTRQWTTVVHTCIFQILKIHIKSRKKSHDYNIFTTVIRAKRILLTAKKKFRG